MRKSSLWTAVPALALALALSACGGGEPAAQSSTPPAAGKNCPDDVAGARQVRFGSNGAENLVGAIWGNGKTGVILAHQNGGSVCQWVYNAKALSAQGYRVMAFDFAGFGQSDGGSALDDDVRAATEFLRKDGAAAIVLIGASMGGTSVIAAAGQITPPVTAVVSLSGPASFNRVNAAAFAPKLTMPVLYEAGSFESGFADDAKAMYEASTASSNRMLLLAENSSDHGVALVLAGFGRKDAVQALDEFLKANAPA